MVKIENKGKSDIYVYDISLDGTVVNAFGRNVISNTDGFNFQKPDKYRYTEEHPYIGRGWNRGVKKGKVYTGSQADLAEYNDVYLSNSIVYSPIGVNLLMLDDDECPASTINFARKTYADFFPNKPYPEDVKLVGNSIKGKKIEGYIQKYLDKVIRLLLQNKGAEMLEEYYSMVEKVYNYQIPLKDIASKGKVKKRIPEYLEDCKTLTKAGRPKSRQAWMELAIRDGLNPDLGETIYYINTGNSKSQTPIKKVTHYYRSNMYGDTFDVATTVEKEYRRYKKEQEAMNREPLDKDTYVARIFPDVRKEEEIIFNSYIVPNSVIESDDDVLCEDGMEYNVPKYIEKLNNKTKPLLVCFSREIRDKILITNPEDRPYFTKEQTVLINGEPNKPGDQDTYEELMTMEDKEIRFWKAHPEFEIPYLKECGMDWDEIVSDYDYRMAEEKRLGVDTIREQYEKIISEMTDDEIDAFIEDGKLPAKLDRIVDIDPNSAKFICKQYPEISIGNINDILEKNGDNDDD